MIKIRLNLINKIGQNICLITINLFRQLGMGGGEGLAFRRQGILREPFYGVFQTDLPLANSESHHLTWSV